MRSFEHANYEQLLNELRDNRKITFNVVLSFILYICADENDNKSTKIII